MGGLGGGVVGRTGRTGRAGRRWSNLSFHWTSRRFAPPGGLMGGLGGGLQGFGRLAVRQGGNDILSSAQRYKPHTEDWTK